MTAAELRERYARGERDFRGADLRGLDLSGADLSGARLDEVRCGVPWRWRIIKGMLQVLMGVVAGVMEFAGVAILDAILSDKRHEPLGAWFRYAPGVQLLGGLLVALILLVRRGTGSAGAGAGAGSIAVAVASAAAVTFARDLTAASVLDSAVVVVVDVVAAGAAGAVAGAGPIAVAVAGAIAVAGAVAGASAVVGAGAGAVALALAITICSLLIARRARTGDPRYANVRDLHLAMTSLWGTRLCGAKLCGASLAGADLQAANLMGATLDGCIFVHASHIERARFSPGPLRLMSTLRLLSQGQGQGASLSNLDLHGLAIRDADLRGANLSNADLRWCDLRGTDLTCAANLKGARVDPDTYARSGWTPEYLQSLQRRGVQIQSLNQFPEEVQDLLLGTHDGLTLYFDRVLTSFDHLLIQSVITQELGPETDCRVAELREKEITQLHAQRGDRMARAEVRMEGARALVRLKASHREDLLRIADRLYRCVWERQQEQQQQEQSQALVRQQQDFGLVLSQKDKDHQAALAHLVRLYQEHTAPHVQSIELHDPIEGGTLADTRRPTRRSVAWDMRHNRILTARSPRRLAILAAPEDSAHRDALLKQMSGLCQSGLLLPFHEGHLLAGTDRPAALRELIEGADLVLCLVSADLLAALFPDDAGVDAAAQGRAHLAEALRAALTRREQDGLPVIPVLLRPANVADSPFRDLQPLPRNGQPISKWHDYDEALLEVVAGVRLHLTGASIAAISG